MAELGPCGAMSDKESQMKQTLMKLAPTASSSSSATTTATSSSASSTVAAAGAPPTDPALIQKQHQEYLSMKQQISQQQSMIDALRIKSERVLEESNDLKSVRMQLEERLVALEMEYEQLLDRTFQEEEQQADDETASLINDLRTKLEMQYNTKRDIQESEMEKLALELQNKDEFISQLRRYCGSPTLSTQGAREEGLE